MVRCRLGPAAVALGCLLAVAIASPANAGEGPVRGADVSALRAAAGEGRVRVIVELRLGPNASPRTIRATQRKVVGGALGAGVWARRESGTEPHSLSLMSITPAFAATVSAAELDRLAARPEVRRIGADGLSRPMGGGFSAPH
jgi:hypothetical protein